jgi:ribosomal protein S18 acetylase RimI-like enzyme
MTSTTVAEIRPATSDDADAIDGICRATANGGGPQPSDVVDPLLVSLVYALPYVAFEPATARVLVQDGIVTGYVVGALNSNAFYRRAAREWAPRHQPRPDGADPELVSLLADPMRALPEGVEGFPSHLHINLAATARSDGWGSRLLTSFIEGLVAAGSHGVHLRVGAENEAAVRFYRRHGFTVLGGDSTLTMGRRLV